MLCQAPPYRRSLRLKGYVSICTQDRVCLFGDVAGETVYLNEAGQMADALWADLPMRFPGVELDIFVVMPNHIHGIVVLPDRSGVGAPLVGAREIGQLWAARASPTRLGDLIGAFKSPFTVRYIQGVKKGQLPRFDRRVWQRNYHEHVIRDEADLSRIRAYIDQNPLQWHLDDENPENIQLKS